MHSGVSEAWAGLDQVRCLSTQAFLSVLLPFPPLPPGLPTGQLPEHPLDLHEPEPSVSCLRNNSGQEVRFQVRRQVGIQLRPHSPAGHEGPNRDEAGERRVDLWVWGLHPGPHLQLWCQGWGLSAWGCAPCTAVLNLHAGQFPSP